MTLMRKLTFLLTLLFIIGFQTTYAEEDNDTEEASETEEGAEGGTENESKAPLLPRVGHLNMEALRQQLLAEELKPSEVVWLEVEYPLPAPEEGKAPLTDSTPPEPVKVLALKQKSHRAQKHGAALILHDKEQHADWPQLIRPLRKNLPATGWFTLSVNLPQEKQYFKSHPDRTLPPKSFDEVVVSDSLRQVLESRIPSSATSTDSKSEEEADETDESSEEETDTAEESIDEEPIDEEPSAEAENSEGTDDENVDIDLAVPEKESPKIPYEDRALAHLEAGMQHLNKEGYLNIVMIAYRASANSALKYIEKNQGQYSDRGFALVLIDPIIEHNYQEDIAKALGENFPAPVLEIISEDSDKNKVLASERVVSAGIAGINRYMQIKLPSANDTLDRVIPRRVRFWMEKYAPGMVMKGR